MSVQTVTRPSKRLAPAGREERRWLSYAEPSELCTLSVRSLKRLTAEGTLPCYVIGGKVLRIKAPDVEALIVPTDECRGW